MTLRKLRARGNTEPGSARLSLPRAGTQHRGKALPSHFLPVPGPVSGWEAWWCENWTHFPPGLTRAYMGKSDQVIRTRKWVAFPDHRLPAQHPQHPHSYGPGDPEDTSHPQVTSWRGKHAFETQGHSGQSFEGAVSTEWALCASPCSGWAGVRALGGGSCSSPTPPSCVSPLPTVKSSSPVSPNHVTERGRYTLTRRPDLYSAKPDNVIFIFLTSVTSSVKWDQYQPLHKALRGSERPGVCKVQRPECQTLSFVSCSWFKAWLKPLLIPDPPEPGEGALPDCKSWAPVGLCPASRGRFPVPWPMSPSSAEALDTTRSSLCGRGSPQLRAGGRTHTPQPTTGPSSPRLPSGPPVNAAAQQEQPRVGPQPKGGATHSQLGTASWSPGLCRDPEATVHHSVQTNSSKERLPAPTFYKWGN